MKKLTRILALLLALVMIFALAACGSSSQSTDEGSANAGNETEVTTTADEGGDGETEAEETTADEGGEEETEGEEEPPENLISGDPSAEDAFVIWAWNTDFETLQNLLIEDDPSLADRIVFVNTGGSGYYQDKLDAILMDESNELYPDLMLLEVGYVKKYTNSGYLISLADLGITDDELASQMTYNIELGSADDGTQYASFWQATPGCVQVRADLAEKYLGTTDQAEIEEIFSSWDSILDAARSVNEASGGMVKLFSGYDDLKYVFLNGARTSGWYDENDVIQFDPSMEEYLELCRTLYTEDLTFNANMWDTDWSTLMDGDGETSEAAIAYCGCPWFTYWCLTDTWTGNTILADYPIDFYWGGTGIAATVGCSDTDLAAEIIRKCTTDADFMVRIYKGNGDYVNNTEALADIIAGDIPSTSAFSTYGDQNIVEFFSQRGQHIDTSCVVAEDQGINESLLVNAATAYATSDISMEDAIADFKAAVHDTYNYLSVE